MHSWKKPAQWTMALAISLTASCSTYSVSKREQPLAELCLEEAMTECAELSEPERSGFVTATKWGADYAYCQLKHKVLIHCVQDHDKDLKD
jgi:hypothetical protein